jgi:hypothetical protein
MNKTRELPFGVVLGFSSANVRFTSVYLWAPTEKKRNGYF